jgi:hypothetical protein
MAFLVIVIRIGQIAYLAAPRPATCSSTMIVQSGPDILALEAAEDGGFVDGGGGILLSILSGC